MNAPILPDPPDSAQTGNLGNFSAAVVGWMQRTKGVILNQAFRYNVSTTGHNVPLMDQANTWTGAQKFNGSIIGTATNDNAPAGSVGEFISSNVASPGGNISTTTPTTITSINLTPGDWDVWGNVAFVPAGTTTVSAVMAGISTTNNAFGTAPNGGAYQILQASFTTGSQQILSAGLMRLSFAVTTAVYLIGQINFAVSTCTAFGFIGARRAR